MLDLVGDNQLAVLKIRDRQIVSRTLTPSIRNCAFESRVSPLQIGNGCLRHGPLPYSRIYVEKNAKKAETPLMWIKGMAVKPRKARKVRVGQRSCVSEAAQRLLASPGNNRNDLLVASISPRFGAGTQRSPLNQRPDRFRRLISILGGVERFRQPLDMPACSSIFRENADKIMRKITESRNT
jgi:hypothetical protein